MKSKTNSISCSITPDHVPNRHHKIHASVEIRLSQSFTPTPNSFCTSTCLTPRVSAISPISPCPMSLISLYSCSNRICRFTVSDGSFLRAVLFSHCLFYTLLQDKRSKKSKRESQGSLLQLDTDLGDLVFDLSCLSLQFCYGCAEACLRIGWVSFRVVLGKGY